VITVPFDSTLEAALVQVHTTLAWVVSVTCTSLMRTVAWAVS
jgi:hypothetical protein